MARNGKPRPRGAIARFAISMTERMQKAKAKAKPGRISNGGTVTAGRRARRVGGRGALTAFQRSLKDM